MMSPYSLNRVSSGRPAAVRALAVVLLICAFVLLTGLMDGGAGILPQALWNGPAWQAWWNPPLRMFSNALPGLLLALLLLALTRRALLSFFVAFLVEALLYAVNLLKVANLGTPLMPADFQMVGQMDQGGGDLLSGYLPHSVWPYLLIVLGIAVLVALIRYETPLLAPRWRGRIVGAMVSAALLATFLLGSTFWSVVYNPGRLGLQPWSAKATAKHTGLISSLMLYRLKYGAAQEKPDVNAALQLMARYDQKVRDADVLATAASATPPPDIVIILSESFFDPTILNGYAPDVDFMPNLRRLAQHGTSGTMHSPTFGGGTIRTEFEVLTGLPLRYFPTIQFPYLQIHQKVIPSLVRDLKKHGYQTLAVHGNDPAFWNRTTAFKELGFDKFISQGDFPADDKINDGKYMSDKSFTDELLRQLKPDGPPRFVLGISIEAHGPYDQDYGIDTQVRDAIPVPAKVTGEAKRQLQNYIYHIGHADKQLGRLVDTLAQRKRRTIVVFFGDHLPAIVPAFQQAGFRNGKGFLVQTVPYLVVDTSKAHGGKPVQQDVAAWELPGLALDRAGLHIDPWFALTQAVAPQLESLTRAFDAPKARENATQKQLDIGMSNAAKLRLAGKLDALWPKAAAMARQQQADSTPRPSAPAVTRSAPAAATSAHTTH